MFNAQNTSYNNKGTTHQFLGISKIHAADMNNHMIHSVETSTHMKAHKKIDKLNSIFSCMRLNHRIKEELDTRWKDDIFSRMRIAHLACMPKNPSSFPSHLCLSWYPGLMEAEVRMTYLPLAFWHHSSARIFLSATLRDMLSPVVPFTVDKTSLVLQRSLNKHWIALMNQHSKQI